MPPKNKKQQEFPPPPIDVFNYIGADDGCIWLNMVKDRVKNQQTIKVAAFDMDDTLITPLYPTRLHPFNEHDWKWITEDTLDVLNEEAQKGFIIIVFSNKKNLSAKKENEIKQKFSFMVSSAANKHPDLRISAVFARSDQYYKPNIDLWHLVQNQLRADGVLSQTGSIDIRLSYFCGDAAGRKRKHNFKTLALRDEDHSADDMNFAANIGLDFFLPEDMFSGKLSTALKYQHDLVPEDAALYNQHGMREGAGLPVLPNPDEEEGMQLLNDIGKLLEDASAGFHIRPQRIDPEEWLNNLGYLKISGSRMVENIWIHCRFEAATVVAACIKWKLEFYKLYCTLRTIRKGETLEEVAETVGDYFDRSKFAASRGRSFHEKIPPRTVKEWIDAVCDVLMLERFSEPQKRFEYKDKLLPQNVTCIQDGVPLRIRGPIEQYSSKHGSKVVVFQVIVTLTGRPIAWSNYFTVNTHDSVATHKWKCFDTHFKGEAKLADLAYINHTHTLTPIKDPNKRSIIKYQKDKIDDPCAMKLKSIQRVPKIIMLKTLRKSTCSKVTSKPKPKQLLQMLLRMVRFLVN
jgi:DNA 3'-phosphatase